MSDLYPTKIETERLRFVPVHTQHVLDAYEICSRPEMEDVTRFMPWGRHETPKVTFDFLSMEEDAWNDSETADYVIFPREGEEGAGDVAGFGGLNTEWDRRVGELGLWLRPRFWGRGYSGERAHALAALAFDVLDLEVVTVSHVVENEKSQRAIEKYVNTLGGRRDGVKRNNIIVDGEPRDEYFYTISHGEWLGATGGEYDAEFYWG
jgi:RimJ/RimL family protein N-acetyltransferase